MGEAVARCKPLSKAARAAVLAKSGGRCWYCGDDLPEKGWHADHCEPVFRIPGRVINAHRDVIENIVPACRTCNLFKGGMGVELFREQLAAQVERGRQSSVNFRMAERYGLITANDNPVTFWFERPTPPGSE